MQCSRQPCCKSCHGICSKVSERSRPFPTDNFIIVMNNKSGLQGAAPAGAFQRPTAVRRLLGRRWVALTPPRRNLAGYAKRRKPFAEADASSGQHNGLCRNISFYPKAAGAQCAPLRGPAILFIVCDSFYSIINPAGPYCHSSGRFCGSSSAGCGCTRASASGSNPLCRTAGGHICPLFSAYPHGPADPGPSGIF